METWPIRSRGFMSGVLQGSWGLGFLLSSAIYGLFYNYTGWRGMLWVGIAPALALVYIRFFVKEPEVWLENRKLQRTQKREVRVPLLTIFKRGMLGNTLTTCWFQAAGFVTYYSINALFATHLQKDLGLSPALIATPLVFANLLVFFASSGWGWVSDRLGRRPAMIIPALCAIPLVPIYLFSGNFTVIVIAFVAQGIFAGGGMYGQVPSYLTERFPTEIRGTATGFCYHVGAIPGAMVPPILTFFAAYFGTSLAIPMLIGTLFGLANFILSVVFGPETKGTEMVPDLVVA